MAEADVCFRHLLLHNKPKKWWIVEECTCHALSLVYVAFSLTMSVEPVTEVHHINQRLDHFCRHTHTKYEKILDSYHNYNNKNVLNLSNLKTVVNYVVAFCPPLNLTINDVNWIFTSSEAGCFPAVNKGSRRSGKLAIVSATPSMLVYYYLISIESEVYRHSTN